MKYQDLLEKYNILLEEVDRLKYENRQLRASLGLRESKPFPKIPRNFANTRVDLTKFSSTRV